MEFLELRTPTPSSLSFEVKNVDVSIMNCVRRVALSEIPTVGIRFDPYNELSQDVTVYTNTCPLHNEMLTHRLSLIPIGLHPNEVKSFEKMRYLFAINKKNTTNEMVDVSTDDIEVLDENNEPYPKDLVGRLFPHDPITKDPILITKLKPNLFDKDNGDHLHLEARASVGTASDNAAWSAVSLCTYHNKVDPDEAEAAFEANVKQVDKPLTPDERNDLKRHFDTLERFKYFYKNQYLEPNHFVMELESETAYSPVYIVTKAITLLLQKVLHLKGLVSSGEVVAEPIGERPHFFQIIIPGETHTLGNLIQALGYNHFVRDANKKELEYIGYYVPHPLEKRVVIKMKMVDTFDDKLMQTWIMSLVDAVARDVHAFLMAWIPFARLSVDEYADVKEFMSGIPAYLTIREEPVVLNEPLAPAKKATKPKKKAKAGDA